jgi:phosphonate transport system substrate-binding protein
VIPHQSPEKQQEKLNALVQYLQNKLQIPVQIQISKNYDSAVDLLVDGQVKMAYLGAVTYIEAKERNSNLEAILAPIEKSTGRPWYSSVIISNTTAEIKSLDDLKNKRFGFVSKSSTSGYLIPTVHLQESGITPNMNFKKIEYAGSHNQNIALLKAGTVDAIAIDKQSYLRATQSKQLNPAQYQILWESDPIPNPPIVINTQLPSEFIVTLKKVMVEAPEGLVDLTGSESAGYTLVSDEYYEPIRKLEKSLKQQ